MQKNTNTKNTNNLNAFHYNFNVCIYSICRNFWEGIFAGLQSHQDKFEAEMHYKELFLFLYSSMSGIHLAVLNLHAFSLTIKSIVLL